MNKNKVSLFVKFILFIFFIQGCGIVQRTIYPERYIGLRYECRRNVNIFLPNEYKIYYSINNSNWIYDGTSKGGKHTIELKEKYFSGNSF